MEFKDYLKKNKIKVKKDNGVFKENRYYSPYASNVKKYEFVTNEDVERIMIMEKFLTKNTDIDSNIFWQMLEETPKYKAVAIKYPYKKTIAEDLRRKGYVTFVNILEHNIRYNKQIDKFLEEKD